jgi:putative transposase
MGMLLGIVVLPANFSDEFGAKALLKRIPFVLRWALFLFDAGYDKPPFIHWCQTLFGVTVEISRRLAETGFQVLPKRWIVERTLGWFNYSRRLSKDYEQRPDISEAMIYLSMTRLMLKRLHPK